MAITDPAGIDAALEIEHHFAHLVYAKRAVLRKGRYVEQHIHHYTHLGILATGSVMVIVDGVSTRHEAGSVITVKAGSVHGIEALEDSIWFCVHGTDETDPSKVDEIILKG